MPITRTTSSRAQQLVARSPFTAFVVLAFALSWGCWLLWRLTSGGVFFFLGGLGPAAAGALVAWQTGALPQWWRRVSRWRVHPGFYVVALGLPVLLYGLPNLVAAAFGQQVDWSLAVQRIPAYAATWVGALLMGGLEEPGWRGFAQPHLQTRLSPVAATLAVGVVWGLWHLPVQPLAIVVTVPLSFLYTWLLNGSGSALLCVLLHASLTPAQDHLVLVPDGPLLDAAVLGVLVLAAMAAVLLSHRRLGLPSAPAAPDGGGAHGGPLTRARA
jgi:membrane protease YdiL (CAAX protease family)